MKEARGDKVVDILRERGQRVKALIHKQMKGTKPFRKEPMDNDMALFIYENMSSATAGDEPDVNDPTYRGDFEYLLENYDEDAIQDWLFRMEKLKQRRAK